jgi:hypothetical protein
MVTIAVAKLSDGRLQFWTGISPFMSAWQTSFEPKGAWTPLSPFAPGAESAAAGHSPDGRVQVWVSVSGRLQSTWKTSCDPDSGWIAPWQAPFEPDPGPINDIAVGQLSDGRMQAFATSSDNRLLTTWKTSCQPNSPWAAWQAFSPDPGPVNGQGGVGGHMLAAEQLPDSRLQLWFVDFTGVSGEGRLKTSWKTSCDPRSPWSPPQAFEPDPGTVICVAAGQLSDGRLQLWVVPLGGHLQTTWKASRGPNSSWVPWQAFSPNPGPVSGLVAGRLWDRRLKLWALGSNFPPGGLGVLTIEKTTAIADAPWWANWKGFG